MSRSFPSPSQKKISCILPRFLWMYCDMKIPSLNSPDFQVINVKARRSGQGKVGSRIVEGCWQMLTRKGSKICFLRPLVLLERSFPYAVLFLGQHRCYTCENDGPLPCVSRDSAHASHFFQFTLSVENVYCLFLSQWVYFILENLNSIQMEKPLCELNGMSLLSSLHARL